MIRIFLYGTLMRGEAHHDLLHGQTFLGLGALPAGYTLYAIDYYPGMVASADDGDGVHGEVWSVDDGCLAKLDQLEGLQEGLYARISLPLRDAGAMVEAYRYLHSVENRPHIGPDWKAYRRQNKLPF